MKEIRCIFFFWRKYSSTATLPPAACRAEFTPQGCWLVSRYYCVSADLPGQQSNPPPPLPPPRHFCDSGFLHSTSSYPRAHQWTILALGAELCHSRAPGRRPKLKTVGRREGWGGVVVVEVGAEGGTGRATRQWEEKERKKAKGREGNKVRGRVELWKRHWEQTFLSWLLPFGRFIHGKDEGWQLVKEFRLIFVLLRTFISSFPYIWASARAWPHICNPSNLSCSAPQLHGSVKPDRNTPHTHTHTCCLPRISRDCSHGHLRHRSLRESVQPVQLLSGGGLGECHSRSRASSPGQRREMSSYYPRSKDLTRTRKSLTDSPPSSPSPTDKNYRVRPGAFLLQTHSFWV